MATETKNTAFAPWFGTNRMTAEKVADKLAGLDWLGVVFAGGMSELAHVSCRSIVVNDLHRHVINLAVIVALGKDRLANELAEMPFHPDVLRNAQDYCERMELQAMQLADVRSLPGEQAHEWARNYFIAVWMGRSAKAGTIDEFKGNLSTRPSTHRESRTPNFWVSL